VLEACGRSNYKNTLKNLTEKGEVVKNRSEKAGGTASQFILRGDPGLRSRAGQWTTSAEEICRGSYCYVGNACTAGKSSRAGEAGRGDGEQNRGSASSSFTGYFSPLDKGSYQIDSEGLRHSYH